jgi:hypothetical protein
MAHFYAVSSADYPEGQIITSEGNDFFLPPGDFTANFFLPPEAMTSSNNKQTMCKTRRTTGTEFF